MNGLDDFFLKNAWTIPLLYLVSVFFILVLNRITRRTIYSIGLFFINAPFVIMLLGLSAMIFLMSFVGGFFDGLLMNDSQEMPFSTASMSLSLSVMSILAGCTLFMAKSCKALEMIGYRSKLTLIEAENWSDGDAPPEIKPHIPVEMIFVGIISFIFTLFVFFIFIRAEQYIFAIPCVFGSMLTIAWCRFLFNAIIFDMKAMIINDVAHQNIV